MLSLDLFDSRYEKKLHEGALDDTVTRTQAHSMEPLSRRAADIRTQIRSGKLSGVELDKLEKEYEDLVQKRLDIMLDRQPKNEQQVPSKQDPFAYVKPEPKGIGDIQDPRAKMAQLAQRAKKGPLANVGAGIKGFLTGKEEPLDEQELGRRGIGVRNMKALEATIRQGLAKTVFQFPKVRAVAADEEDSDKLADYYNGLDSAGRSNFVYNVLGDPMKFVTLCKTLNIQLIPVGAIQPDLPGIPSQGEIPLEEKKNQKKKFKSTVAQREIEKAMAAEPAAGDPIEAFVLKSLKTDSEQDQQIQDLENKLQNVVTKTVATEPTVMPKVQPSATVATAPTTAKPAPTPTSTATQAPVELPTPTPTAEPAPTAAELPKKDQKILSRVKSIEKRLKDRVDAYQDARAQQDKATLQQQIDALQTQARQQASKLSSSGRLVLGQDDVYDIDANLVREPELEPIPLKKAAESKMQEHGGGIGPRQHWQDLMQEGQPQELINRYLAIDAETDVDAVRKAIQAISRDPELGANSKSRLLGQIGMIIKRHRLPIGRAYYQFMQQYMEAVEMDRTKVAGYPNDPATVKHRLDTAKAILSNPASDADSRREAAGIVAKLDKKLVAETVTNVKAGMAEIYRRLAPKIERHRDSFLAGQLYDELENYAELHGAEGEFKRMMSTARNRAHMEYDTDPGGFQNWFWFLPFEDNDVTESINELKKKMSKLEALALAANRAGDDAKCKMYQQKIQSLKQKLSQSMAEGWSDQGNPTPYSVYIDGREWRAYKSDDHARAVAEKVRANLKRQGREQTVTIAPSQRKQVEETHDSKLELAAKEFIKGIYDPTGPVYRAAYRSFHKGQDAEAQLRKHIAQKYGVSEKDLSDAETTHRASKLAGPRRKKDVEEDFGMPGTTIPRKSLIQGYTVFWNPKTQVVSVTRGGDSEEAAIEQARVGTPSIKNFRQAADRLIDRIESDLNEGREIQTREDFIRERDRLLRMIGIETDPANKQILKSAIRQLENRAENEGWITIQSRMVREDSDGGEAVEMAIMRRMLVAHTDLIVEFGLDKVVQAIEEVAYNVGDTDEIGSSDVSGWVRQVKQILGADA